MFTIILYIFLIYLVIDFLKKNFIKNQNNNVKQPWALPIIGNLYNLGASPHEALRSLSKVYGKVHGLWFADVYTVVVSDLEIAREIFVKNFDNFQERPRLPSFNAASHNFQGVVVGDEYWWKIAKKKIANAFQKTKLSHHAYDLVHLESERLVESFKHYAETGQPAQPRRICQRYSFNIILRYCFNSSVSYEVKDKSEMFGTDEKNLNELLECIDEFLKMVAAGNICDFLDIAQSLYKKYLEKYGPHLKIQDSIRNIYKDHEKSIDYDNPRDLMDQLIIETKNIQEDSNTTHSLEDDIIQNILIGFDFFIAGSDTSSNTLEWFMLMMANYPEVQEKIYGELQSLNQSHIKLNNKSSTPYLNAVIKEVLRKHVVAPLSLPRVAKEDITLSNGITIPAKTQIIQNLGGISMDENYFDEPNQFKPERFLAEPNSPYHVVFGLGNRQCAGSQLALDQIYAATSNLILNYKISRISEKLISEDEKFALTIHPKEHYYVNIISRK